MINEISKINEKEMEIQSEEQAYLILVKTFEEGYRNKPISIEYELETEARFTFYIKFDDGYEGVYSVDKRDGFVQNATNEISRPIMKTHSEKKEFNLSDKYQTLSPKLNFSSDVLGMLDKFEEKLNFEIDSISEYPNKLRLYMIPIIPGRTECPIYIHRHTRNNRGIRIEHSRAVTYPNTGEFRNVVGSSCKDKGNNLFYEIEFEQFDAWMKWIEAYYTKTWTKLIEEEKMQDEEQKKIDNEHYEEKIKESVDKRTEILKRLDGKACIPESNEELNKTFVEEDDEDSNAYFIRSGTIHFRYAHLKLFGQDVIVYTNIRLTGFGGIRGEFRVQIGRINQDISDYHFNTLMDVADISKLDDGQKRNIEDFSDEDWVVEKLTCLIDYVDSLFNNEENLFKMIKVC